MSVAKLRMRLLLCAGSRRPEISSVFGPTCDALDTISLIEELPDLEMGGPLYAENIGAYSAASTATFNGFPPAKVVHVNQEATVDSPGALNQIRIFIGIPSETF